jgi:hypothetical protein
MNEEQRQQFNAMRRALHVIAHEFQRVDQLRSRAEKVYGLPFCEALEMAYENMQFYAIEAVDGVDAITESA